VPSEDGHDFYGKMEDVIVMSYRDDCHVVLFKCLWYGDKYDPRNRVRKDKTFGVTSVYVDKTWFDGDPFILATQARQVFYIDDIYNGSRWKVVEECNHRHMWDLPTIDDPSSSTTRLAVQPSYEDDFPCRHETTLPELVIDSDVITRTENENVEDEEDTNVVLVGDDDDFIDEDIESDADIQNESEYE